MKTKLFAGFLAIALLAGGWMTFNANAALKDGTIPSKGGRLLERAKAKLGITDEQAAEIKAQLKSEKENLTTLLTRLHEARAALRQAIQAPDATEASVRVASAKVAAVEADMAVERLTLHGKIAPILTAEQQKKWQELRARRGDFADRLVKRMNNRLGD